ncbi:MAG TPA: Gfo/Idh/MocA family oxidoreductase [Gemmataceae bacterium]
MSGSIDRRGFLHRTGAAALAVTAAGYTATSRGYAANETITVACIGTGGRCRALMDRLKLMQGVRIAAVCDVWDHHLHLARELAGPKAAAETDYRRLLERKDIDAVVIASPDHWHVPMTVDACDAGKDVYVEKPLTHDLSEGKRVVEAQDRNKRIVQVGTQQRSMPHLIEAREIVRSGTLGRVHKIRLSWNRNQARWARKKPKIDPKSVRWKQFLGSAPEQPFDAYRFRNWRWFWDFGGGIFTDLMVHWIDTAYWMLDMGNPATAASIGDHFRTRGLWETPDTVQTLLRYPEDELQAHFEGTFASHRHRAMLELMGDKAALYVDRGRYELHPEQGSGVAAKERIDARNPVRGADFYDDVDGETYHLSDWLRAVRSRKKPSCPAEEGVRSAAAAHLANIALRAGKVARWEEHAPRG